MLRRLNPIISNPFKSISWEKWGIGLLVLIGLAVRIYFASRRDLWYDELVTYKIATSPLQSLIELNKASNSAPLLYVVILHFISKFAGQSELFIRSVSILAGVIAIPFSYLCGKVWFSSITGMITACLVTFVSTQIQYSGELREYSLTVMLTFTSLFFLNQAISKPHQSKWFILLIIALSIMLWTQYGLAIVVGGIVLSMLFFGEGSQLSIQKFEQSNSPRLRIEISLKSILQNVILVGIVAINILLIYLLILQYQFQPGFGDYLSDSYRSGSVSILEGIFNLFMNSKDLLKFSAGSRFGSVPLLIAGGISLFSIIFRHKNSLTKKFLILSATIWLATFGLAVLRIYPYGGIRQDIFLLPFIYILASEGIAFLFTMLQNWRVVIPLAFISSLVITSIIWMSQGNSWVPQEQFSQAVEFLQTSRQSDETIYVTWDTRSAIEFYGKKFTGNILYGGLHTAVDPDILNQCLENGKGVCWVVYEHCPACEQFFMNIPLSFTIKASFQTNNKSVGAYKISKSNRASSFIILDQFNQPDSNWRPSPSNNIDGDFIIENGSLKLRYVNRVGTRDNFGYYFSIPGRLQNVVNLKLKARLSTGANFTVDIQVGEKVVNPRTINYLVGTGDWEEINIPVPPGELKIIYIDIGEPPSFNDKPEIPSLELKDLEAEIVS